MSYDLRKLQLVEATMLKDLKKACEENNIKYYLDSGTLLGAVRHKGFIPWDNDIDVVMPHEDYKRFLKTGQAALGEKYFVQSCYSDTAYYRAYTRIRLNNTTMMYPNDKTLDVHHGIWLDVFPLVDTKKGLSWKLKKFLVRISNVLRMDDHFYSNFKDIKKEKGALACFWLKLLYKTPFGIRKRIQEKLLGFLLRENNGEYVSEISTAIKYISRKEVFEGDAIMVRFEGEEYPAPAGYKEYLTDLYGDYMTLPPIEQRVSHDNLFIDFDNDYTKYMEV